YYDSRLRLQPPFPLAPREWVAQILNQAESA
ncbi:MAG: glycyl-tRNA synthetase subunit alpha, partial [Nitrosomonas europaea]